MPHQKVGEIKRAWLRICQRVKDVGRRIEFVTVSTGQAFDLPSLQHGIEPSTGPTIGIRHKSMIVLLGVALEQCLDASRDLLGPVMQRGIQTLNI